MSLSPLESFDYTSPFDPFTLPFVVRFSPSATYELLRDHWNGLICPAAWRALLCERGPRRMGLQLRLSFASTKPLLSRPPRPLHVFFSFFALPLQFV